MNDQNETAQLRFLEETAIRLRQNGFTVGPIEDHHLPVCWEKGRLCRVSGKGSVLYRQERVDALGAQDALQTVIDTAKMTSEYMAILETATLLKAGGLTGDYRVLADFGSAALTALAFIANFIEKLDAAGGDYSLSLAGESTLDYECRQELLRRTPCVHSLL